MATLLENWRNLAYGNGLDDKQREQLWTGYFTIEKGIYEQILANPTEVVEGTVKELAEKYDTEVMIMTGFLDGINESLKGYENPIETMDEDTKVKIEIDPEKLYYNMVEAKIRRRRSGHRLPRAARYEDSGPRARRHPRSEERRVGKECRSRWSPYH